MSVNQLLCNFPPNSNFQVPTSNQGPVTFSVGGPPGGSGPLPTVTQQVWVAPWGSNTTGTGEEQNPYLTIAHAQSTILDSGPSKAYDIILYPGNYVEAVALMAFVNIIGFNPSTTTAVFEPTLLTGAITLGASFGGAQVGQQAFVTNLDINGATTIDYVALTATSATVAFTNCTHEAAVTLTSNSGQETDFKGCTFFNNFTQIGGNVIWLNCNGTSPIRTLLVEPAVGISAFLNASGGSWAGDVTATQNALNGVQVVINSQGCSMSRGAVSKVATATTTPAIVANFGDLPENVALTGAAAVLDAQMRISHQFTGITASVAGVTATVIGAGGGTVNPPFAAVTTIDLVVPAGLIGATSIETMQCDCSPVGANWATIVGPHAITYACRYAQVGGVPTIHLDILNAGLTFNITDALSLNFSAYLPAVL